MMSGKSKAQQPPKYLNDFSHALAKEVQILLQEVGQLRDERRRLQYEIAELMAVKSKHGAGGEYTPDWKPKEEPLPPEPLPPPPVEEAPQAAKPAWRTVTNYRQEKRERKSRTPKAIAPPPAAAAPPQPELPAWAQWKPNPLLSPQPRAATSSNPLPGPPPPKAPEGLFGPKTPPPK